MNATELLTAVVIVTILVTVLLLGISYLGRRLSGTNARPAGDDRREGSWYFVRYHPEGGAEADD